MGIARPAPLTQTGMAGARRATGVPYEGSGGRPLLPEIDMHLHLLLADVEPKSRSLPSTLLSVALHGAAIIAIVISGQRVISAVSDLITETVQYLYPPPREVGAPRPGAANAGAYADRRVAGPEMPTWKDRANGAGEAPGLAQLGAIFAPNPDLTSIRDEPGVGDNAFSAIEVDSLATVDPTSAGPEYPAALAQRSVEGAATMRFVIDSTGRVDMSTVRVITSSHKLFTQAVVAAMPKMKYHPASIAGRPVRLLVQQSFTFQIQKQKAKIS